MVQGKKGLCSDTNRKKISDSRDTQKVGAYCIFINKFWKNFLESPTF